MRALSWIGLAVVTWFLASACGRAQTPQETNYSCEQLYKQAKTTERVEDCTQVLERIDRARQRAGDAPRQQYLTRLMAWLHNRRGEMYARQAGERAAKGDRRAARHQDGLAQRDFERSLELDPTRWKSQHNLGICCAVGQQYEQAVQLFTQVVEQRPDYADAWFNRAEVRYETGQFALAVNDYTEALALRPQDAGIHAARGHAHFQLRHFDQALEDYEQAIRFAPDQADYFVDRGDVWRATGEWEQAAEDYRQAIHLDPQLGRAYQSAAWLMATCPDPRFRSTALAVEAAEKALQLETNHDFVYIDTLAAAYANAGRFAEAQKTISNALQLAPAPFRKSLQQRQQLYANQQAYRQPAPTAIRQARRVE